eukprot:SAG11_NODE_6064_length_1396_cov_0.983038_2_plen_58_part_00
MVSRRLEVAEDSLASLVAERALREERTASQMERIISASALELAQLIATTDLGSPTAQ